MQKDSARYVCVNHPGALYMEMSEIQVSNSSFKFLQHQGHVLSTYQWEKIFLE